MTKIEAIAIAKIRHQEICKYWSQGGDDYNVQSERWGYKHGWFQVGQFNIGSHDYAPGPTYNID
jgi:hypothetical protein